METLYGSIFFRDGENVSTKDTWVSTLCNQILGHMNDKWMRFYLQKEEFHIGRVW